MNKARRNRIDSISNRLDKIIELMTEIREEIEDLSNEESEARDNFPESMWDTDRYQSISDAADALEEAFSNAEDVESTLNEIMDYLVEASA